MSKSVLIVEDEVINAMALSEMLPHFGYSVIDIVTSGEDAIRSSEEHQPDVVLMDISLQGSIDGLEAAKEIIGRLEIPVIFMTGYDDIKTVEAARVLNPLAFLIKPIDVARLMEILKGI